MYMNKYKWEVYFTLSYKKWGNKIYRTNKRYKSQNFAAANSNSDFIEYLKVFWSQDA